MSLKSSGIRLGLDRITELLKDRVKPQKAVHVAGTNGKGSVCHYTYHMLQEQNIRSGLFTSPHLIDRWDCISLNGKTIPRSHFLSIEEKLRTRSEELKLDVSPFELLTATAFDAFHRNQVRIAVIETGVGGKHDATNIIENPAVTVITKIGLDHEDLLGRGIENIVRHKAGIMKPGSPVVIDGTNEIQVIEMLQKKAKDIGTGPVTIARLNDAAVHLINNQVRDWSEMSEQQKMALYLAANATKAVFEAMGKPLPKWPRLWGLAAKRKFPGRQQVISLKKIIDRPYEVLLDGCHNEDSAAALERTVRNKHQSLLGTRNKVCWVLALSMGKDVHSILKHLIYKGDNVVVTSFGPVDGMPWVKPMPCEEIELAAKKYGPETCKIVPNVLEAVEEANRIAGNEPMIITGSLYLVSDILRLIRAGSRKDKSSEVSTKCDKRDKASDEKSNEDQ